MKKLSIIIVNFNSADYLKKCLISIQRSSFPPTSYEIIIVDNNSQDFSIAEALRIHNLNIMLIKNEENIGFAAANNQGIRKSEGEYILLLNPDTIVNPDTLKIMISYMETHPNVAISTCRVELPSGRIDDACHRGFPTPLNSLFHFLGLSYLFPHSLLFNGYHLGYKDMDQIHEIDSGVGAFMMIRRKAGNQIGWLDEDYFWYGEDIDFCYRVKEKGYKVMYLPTTKIIHYKGISSGIKNHSQDLSTADEATKRLATKARFDVMRIFYKKHYQNKYPKVITGLVLSGIKLKSMVTLL